MSEQLHNVIHPPAYTEMIVENSSENQPPAYTEMGYR